jgi:hypothetical protein
MVDPPNHRGYVEPLDVSWGVRIRLAGVDVGRHLQCPDTDGPASPSRPDGTEPADAAWWRFSTGRAALTASIALPTARGLTGVGRWDLDTGALLWWRSPADRVRPLWTTSALLVDEVVGGGVHRFARYSWPELVLTDELRYEHWDQGLAVEEIKVSRSGRVGVCWLNDGQGVNSYAVLGLDGPLRWLTRAEPRRCKPMFATPELSPDERLVACGPGGTCWWWPPGQDVDLDWDTPSAGGLHEYARLVLHDLEQDRSTEHRLEAELPAGWVPEDPDGGRWQYGPVAIDVPEPGLVRIWLPDTTRVDLRLPLASTVRLPTPDACTAPWTGRCSDPEHHEP